MIGIYLFTRIINSFHQNLFSVFSILLIYLFFLFILDIFNSGFWTSESQDVVRVNQLRENLKSTVLASKASGTTENYLRAFNRWKAFARDALGTSDFPVRPIDCALYLQHLLESFKSVSAINCAFYAFRWAHLLAYFASHRYRREGRSYSPCKPAFIQKKGTPGCEPPQASCCRFQFR